MPTGRRKGAWHRVVSWLAAGLHRALRALLVFLEIIGLRRGPPRLDRQLELARLRLIHTEFRKLLSANDRFLEVMAELDQKLHEGGALDVPYLRRRAVRASVDVFRMISSLNRIAGDQACGPGAPRYGGLQPAFEGLARRIEALFTTASRPTGPAEPPLVLDLGEVGAARADEAGGKLANLGELRNSLALPVPDGFVVTASAYRRFLHERCADQVRAQLMTVFSADDVPRVSSAIRRLLLEEELPGWLSGVILSAADRLAGRLGGAPLLAVRSSALEEDSSRSFAGQFLTRLCVDRTGLVAAYREVVASLYSLEPMCYRRLAGLSGETAAMAVGVVAMVDAAASGVVYSRDPRAAGPGDVLIQAVQGLCVLLADGRTSAELLLIGRRSEPRDGLEPGSLRRRPGRQEVRAVLEAGAPREEPVPASLQGGPWISDRLALKLGEWALLLEERLGGPQDIEWALDRQGKLWLLQARPLTLAAAGGATLEPVAGARLLLRGGETASPGIGRGPAVHVDENSPLESFPAGAVLVAPRSSPRFVRVMDRVRAMVTDAGSTTGHMAAIARELRVPALLNTRTATRDIPEGELVTVDAGGGFVYAGVVESNLSAADSVLIPPAARSAPRSPARTAESRLLEELARLVIPLHLTDPRSPEFSPEGCRSLHDLARFVHEKSYEEMFGLGQRLGEARPLSYELDVFLPIDLYLIDLGGGLHAPPRGRRVRPEQVASVPLAALLRGMTHPRIPRFGPRPLDARGFLSVMLRHATTSPESEPTFRDPCYAMISDHYLNYTSRVGYHFGVVDTFCGPSPNRNYIHLHFRGGAADLVRRSRRARAVAEILRALGLHAELSRDAVEARLSRAPQEETARKLEMIGRLLQFARQMDVAMVSEGSVAVLRDAFLRGDYALEGSSSQAGAPPAIG